MNLSNEEYQKIGKKLARMSQLANARSAAGVFRFEVDGQKRYVRINSEKFRAVSLDADNPCGHLIDKETGKSVNAKTLKSALRDAADQNCKNHPPGNTKPEQRVQAFIIWQALTNPQGLPVMLGIADQADSLWFVADELSLPPIRADIILLGARNGRYFPVFAELKSGRTTAVANQLKAVLDLVSHAHVAPEFRAFLAASTGKPAELIDVDKSLPLLIWGKSKSGRESQESQEMMRKKLCGLVIACHEEAEMASGVFNFRLAEDKSQIAPSAPL